MEEEEGERAALAETWSNAYTAVRPAAARPRRHVGVRRGDAVLLPAFFLPARSRGWGGGSNSSVDFPDWHASGLSPGGGISATAAAAAAAAAAVHFVFVRPVCVRVSRVWQE